MPMTLEQLQKGRWVIDWGWICRGMAIRTVCEVGIGPRDISMLPFFRPGKNCQRLIGVEPNPEFLSWAKGLAGIELFPVAVAGASGRARLLLNGGSSFIDGSWSPTPSPNGKSIEVETLPFSEIDPGDIDVLNLDCEGGEWAALSQMKSSPRLIGVEVWRGNPDGAKILDWLGSRRYAPVFSTGPEGETMIWRNTL